MVKASKISIPETKKNSKAAVSENKVEEVFVGYIDYEDAAQFEAFDNICKDPVNNNVEEESRCALNYSHLKDISENKILNDNTAQKMLRKQFTEANGLQDPVLGQGVDFQVYRSIPFVRALHDGRMHWVAISTYGCNEGEIYFI